MVIILPPLPVQYQIEKMPPRNPELLFDEILHPRDPLVGSFASFHFGTEQGRAN